MKKESISKLSLIFSMTVFGTIGIFRKYIPLSSSVLAITRGLIGAVFILATFLFKKEKISFSAIKLNLLNLCLSGAFIGFNWILLFESYRYTSVATATLCYYMAPVFVILVSPFIFKERLTGQKILCVAAAVTGMVLVSGVIESGFSVTGDLKGVLLGLGAAVFYASVIVLNKKIHDISSSDKTMIQLFVAGVVLIPYALFVGDFTHVTITPFVVAMILLVGMFHTGFAYTLYFGSISVLKTQTVALFSYIDPVIAIILSAVFLHEKMTVFIVAGAALILGSTMVSELAGSRKR